MNHIYTAPLLKPKTGVFAILGYGTMECPSNTEFQAAFNEYYDEIIGTKYAVSDARYYLEYDRRVIDSHFDDEIKKGLFSPPFDANTGSSVVCYETRHFNEMEMFGYLKSFSGYNNYCKMHGIDAFRNDVLRMDGRDPLKSLQECFQKEMAERKEEKMEVKFPFFLITAMRE